MSCSRAGNTLVYALGGRDLFGSATRQAEGDVKEYRFAVGAVSAESAM